MGQREGERLEIVEDHGAFESGSATKLSSREGPERIGEADLLAHDRSGHGKCRMARSRFETLQVGRGSAGKRSMLGAGKVLNIRQFERLKVGHGEAGIRA